MQKLESHLHFNSLNDDTETALNFVIGDLKNFLAEV